MLQKVPPAGGEVPQCPIVTGGGPSPTYEASSLSFAHIIAHIAFCDKGKSAFLNLILKGSYQRRVFSPQLKVVSLNTIS